MRPPLLFLTVAFGVGLWAGLDPFVFAGGALWGVALPLIAAAACLSARAPLGAAVGLLGEAAVIAPALAAGQRRAARSTEAVGTRAPTAGAVVLAPNARVDSDIRERGVGWGLALLLSISGLHVGVMAAWLVLILGKLPPAARARFGAPAVLVLGYLW